MKIGCVKEIKNNEFRVGLTPDNVKAYVSAGHHVYVEKGAGVGSGFTDNEYVDAGASLIDNAADVWNLVDMMIKVKEPLPEEYPLFREGLILYTYLHLAADKQQAEALLAGKVKAVAYETIQEKDRSLPCLAPMSQIAGRLSIQEGAKYLEKKFGGEGILLAGVPGTPKANVVILGGGTVGMNACKIAVGMGANVTILDVNLKRLEELDNIVSIMLDCVCSNAEKIRVNGSEQYTSVVRSQFLKLNNEHIQYVMKCLNECDSTVLNIRAYLITVLYNAPMTMDTAFGLDSVRHSENRKEGQAMPRDTPEQT